MQSIRIKAKRTFKCSIVTVFGIIQKFILEVYYFKFSLSIEGAGVHHVQQNHITNKGSLKDKRAEVICLSADEIIFDSNKLLTIPIRATPEPIAIIVGTILNFPACKTVRF